MVICVLAGNDFLVDFVAVIEEQKANRLHVTNGDANLDHLGQCGVALNDSKRAWYMQGCGQTVAARAVQVRSKKKEQQISRRKSVATNTAYISVGSDDCTVWREGRGSISSSMHSK
jgi:hypothetical protein